MRIPYFQRIWPVLILWSMSGISGAFDVVGAYHNALSFNAAYLNASAMNAAAQEQQEQGVAPLLPQLSLSSSLNETYLTSGSASVSFYQPQAKAQIQQSLIDFNKFSSYGRNKFATQLADLEYLNEQQQLMFKVGTAYFNLLNAEDAFTAVQMTKKALK